jgi:hypothetical protein
MMTKFFYESGKSASASYKEKTDLDNDYYAWKDKKIKIRKRIELLDNPLHYCKISYSFYYIEYLTEEEIERNNQVLKEFTKRMNMTACNLEHTAKEIKSVVTELNKSS